MDDISSTSRIKRSPLQRVQSWRPERCDRIALVLQGGGALGAYQAGVYQAMHEAGVEPDWISGVSIGAINSAIIAGNPPNRRLRQLRTFWERITERKIWPFTPDGDIFRKARNAASCWMTTVSGQPGFFAPRFPNPWMSLTGATTATSYYDTGPLRETLNEGSRGSTAGPGHHRLRGVLICAEIALAMLLLVGSGLLLRSFERMQDTPIGFQADHLFVADLPVSQTAYARPEQRYGFYDRLVDRAQTLPGVRSAAAASYLPVSGGGSIIHFNITGHPPKSPHEYVAAGYCTVTANYFETLGIPLLQGRYLSRSDSDRSPAVVVINSTFAKTYFGEENPLGRRIQLGATPDNTVPTMEIVGVVLNVTQGLGLDPKAEMFVPYKQGDSCCQCFSYRW